MSTQALSPAYIRATIRQTIEKILSPDALWKGIIWHYIPFEAREIDPLYSLFSSSVNLDRLKKSLPKQAENLLEQIYEVPPSDLSQYQGFHVDIPMDVEVFAYTVEQVVRRRDNFIVCELGCSHAKNSMLLAYAGAKEVILNDSSSTSIASIRNRLNLESQNVQVTCKIDEGDCCTILERHPSLKNTVDLIICRNVIHLFDNKQQIKFFNTIHNLLKPDGQAIITSSSIYPFASLKEFDKTDTFSFCMDVCYVYNMTDDSHVSFATVFTPKDNQLLKSTAVYTKSSSIESWERCEDFYLLNTRLKKEIDSYLTKNKEALDGIRKGHIEVSSYPVKFYNRSNFKTLFENSGFIPLEIFVIDKLGHLVRKTADPFIQGQGIGIVVVKP